MSCRKESESYHVEWFVDGSTDVRDATVRLVVGRAPDVIPGKTDDAIDLGHVAMIPGLVNVHTHLEFSLLRQPIATTGRFTDWIRSVVAYRREHAEDVAEAIRQGIDESLRSGTTRIGDIATSGWSEADHRGRGFQGVVFQELLGLGPERIASQMDLARHLSLESTLSASGGLTYGLSPHAPYSVHLDLFRASVELARQSSRPVAMHLAETEAELELLAHGSGEFREMLVEFGLWQPGLFGDGRRPMDYLKALATCSRSLVVHGNYLADDELRFLASQPQMTLVYCPRTHAAFGHPKHPWRRVLELGGSVAIGTDSRASNPDLSVFGELQFLAARHSEISHWELLRLGSECGRVGLGVDNARSNRADFTVIALSDAAASDPASGLFAAGNRVVGTIIDGRWRFAAAELPLPGESVCEFSGGNADVPRTDERRTG